jgi:hypothetical protein
MNDLVKSNLRQLALVVLVLLPSSVLAQFAFFTNSGSITITGYSGPGGAVVIPGETNGLPVTSIDIYAFNNGFNLVSVSIPEGVTNIGFGAFNYCNSLASISMPNTITTIREQAFANCWSLTNVIISSSVKKIETAVFYYCSSLASVTIPHSVTNISESAFFSCTSLTNLTLPDSVQRIGHNSFAFTALTNVSIPSSVTQIEGDTFYACSSLEGIVVDSLNPSYTNRDGVLFSKDLSLLVAYPPGKSGSYTIPDGVTRIGEFAFAACRNLTNITISSSVTNIGFWSFSQCENIRRITLPKSVGYINNQAFQMCTLLREVFFEGSAPGLSGFGSRAFDQVNLYYLPGTTGWDEFFSFLNLIGILWNPTIQTDDASFGVQGNEFGFNVEGTSEIPIVIEATSSLDNSLWVPLYNGPLFNGLMQFSDPQWKNFSQRVYRIRSP